ncbi:MAG: ABC transporter ATP-binding protein [Muribaculaceae bacterium]
MDNILTVEHVSKSFTNHQALDDVSLQVPRGKVYGLLGPNGAGKTTLIRIINHITAPDSGRVVFEGHQLTAADVAHIGYLPEERGLYKKMKVGEQAIFFARLKGLSRREATERLHQWFDRLEITSWWDKKVEELSKGMAQKVQFIVTVLHQPSLLIFDEPFSGFDPINANLLKEEILRLRDQGATVIFSTHNMASVEELCDNITLINKSHNILSGSVDELRHQFGDNTFELSYLGSADALTAALQSLTSSLVALDSEGQTQRVRFAIASGVSTRDLLTAANSAVDIRAFVPQLPSMNDIFIRTVNASNQLTSTPPAL